ncbi:MAG: sporulation and cell division protein SsgA [Frankiales bacterium]|nr:sporulation and cell division protein SsgA [Frankiales bacterium]
MAGRPTSVSTQLQLRLVVPGASSLPVRASLRYDLGDPYAVTVAFHTGAAGSESDSVEWTFARALLTDGVTSPVGEGDVQVWPSSSSGSSVVCLSLSSPSGKALFEVPVPELADFLGQTYAAVPTGSESDLVDVDAELALLLWAEPGT